MTKCPNCNNQKFYILSNGYQKCTICSKKFSTKKVAFDRNVFELFMCNKSALEVSKILECSYPIILKRFDVFRIDIAKNQESYYQENFQNFIYYEEYFFKFNNQTNILDFINLVAFSDGNKIFCSILPSLKKYGESDEARLKEFMRWHKIKDNIGGNTQIKEFWGFLEQNIKIYKGTTKDKFYLYLKEMEHKYNILFSLK